VEPRDAGDHGFHIGRDFNSINMSNSGNSRTRMGFHDSFNRPRSRRSTPAT
jgi:hypothetical protein